MSLCSISTILVFSGCTCKVPEPKVVYVPQKCVVPNVEQPVIDNAGYDKYEDIASKALLNYNAMKKYSEKLLKAQEVCK